MSNARADRDAPKHNCHGPRLRATQMTLRTMRAGLHLGPPHSRRMTSWAVLAPPARASAPKNSRRAAEAAESRANLRASASPREPSIADKIVPYPFLTLLPPALHLQDELRQPHNPCDRSRLGAAAPARAHAAPVHEKSRAACEQLSCRRASIPPSGRSPGQPQRPSPRPALGRLSGSSRHDPRAFAGSGRALPRTGRHPARGARLEAPQ